MSSNGTCNSSTCGNYKCNAGNTACLTTCTANTDCSGDNTCNNGKCGKLSLWRKYLWLWISLIVVAVIMLMVGGYLLLRSMRRPSLPPIRPSYLSGDPTLVQSYAVDPRMADRTGFNNRRGSISGDY